MNSGLRRLLIRQMAPRFSELWGDAQPEIRCVRTATRTLDLMSSNPAVVFQAQHDARGRLVATSMIVDRDTPDFGRTGPHQTDRYGEHWVANVYTAHGFRGRGHAWGQLVSLQRIAAQRGWPHLWLYCKDEQDGVDLPRYYRDKLGFAKCGEELLPGAAQREKVNIMRFDVSSFAVRAGVREP